MWERYLAQCPRSCGSCARIRWRCRTSSREMSAPYPQASRTGSEDLQAIAGAYLESFASRDLERCLRYFADDAVLRFDVETFHDRKGIEQWHKDRFAVDFRVLRIDDIQTIEDTVW